MTLNWVTTVSAQIRNGAKKIDQGGEWQMTFENST